MKQRIAVVFDWDHTLAPIYMQGPIFTHYGVSEKDFWTEVHRRTAEDSRHLETRCFPEHIYLHQMVEYANRDIFPGLDNAKLTELGKTIPTFPGVEDIMEELHQLGVTVHIVTSGIRSMLLEHPAIPHVNKKNIHGADFLDYHWRDCHKIPMGRIMSVAKSILPSDKIRVLEEVAKGCSDNFYDACVPLPLDQYTVPYKNMIYVGDGISDIYAFQAVRKNGGYAVGVYATSKSFKQIEMIRQDGFLDIMGVADYRSYASVGSWIINKVKAMKAEMEYEASEIEELRLQNIRSHAPEFIFPWSK